LGGGKNGVWFFWVVAFFDPWLCSWGSKTPKKFSVVALSPPWFGEPSPWGKPFEPTQMVGPCKFFPFLASFPFLWLVFFLFAFLILVAGKVFLRILEEFFSPPPPQTPLGSFFCFFIRLVGGPDGFSPWVCGNFLALTFCPKPLTPARSRFRPVGNQFRGFSILGGF